MRVIHYSHSNFVELSIINCGQGTEKNHLNLNLAIDSTESLYHNHYYDLLRLGRLHHMLSAKHAKSVSQSLSHPTITNPHHSAQGVML